MNWSKVEERVALPPSPLQRAFVTMSSSAASVWEESGRSLVAVEADIHDGVPLDQLQARADGYVNETFRLFPWLTVAPDAAVVEVGPGVGYIMQAFARRTGVSKVVGLDVSAGMIAHARQRVARDGLPAERFDFRHYDGVKFPFKSASVDVFYSVAAIQHVPKPFAYNIFREMKRCLKPTGCAVVHLLSWDELALGHEPFSDEIDRQIGGAHGHWHHYYDYVELDRLLRHGLGIRNYDIREAGGIWVAWGGGAVTIPGRTAAREDAESYVSLRDQRDSLRRERDVMRSSVSWRVTAPLRSIRRLFAGRS
jgi:SAM-dependent methyltransferase